MNNLLAAIMTLCVGSSLSVDVGGRIFLDEAPEATEYPYVVVRIVASAPQDTFADAIEDTLIQFSLFSTAKGAYEIREMYADLVELFDGQELTVAGGTCIRVVRQGSQPQRMFDRVTTPSGTVGLRYWAVDYSVLVQSVPPIVWEEKTSDDYWYDAIEVDLSLPWNSYGGDLYLGIYGFRDWNLGYRPAKLRVTWTGTSPLFVRLWDRDDVPINLVSEVPVASGTEFILEFHEYDISRLYMTSADFSDFEITKIEFGSAVE